MAKTMVAASVICYVNGRALGTVSSFSFQSVTPRKAIRGIDSNIPYELAPTTSAITGTLELYRMDADGGIEGYLFTAPFDELPTEKYFSLQLINTKTDTVLFQADYCSVESQSWNVSSKTLVTGTVNFSALYWNNEFANLKNK